MKIRKLLSAESTAVIVTVLGLAAVTVWPFLEEARSASPDDLDVQTITLTGFAGEGVWTDAEVRGGNYFAGHFPPARPVLTKGAPVLLRLKSADVVHRFYAPELGVGPVDVYPGRVTELEFTPAESGAFDYYCMTFCGKPHFLMRGLIVVEDPRPRGASELWEEPPPATTSLVDRGEWLFRQKSCFACHGKAGRGGVRNPNYVNETVPALDTLAERMFLFYPEDVEAIVAALERRTPLVELEDDPPVPRFSAVLAQYESIRRVLEEGNVAGKKDPEGPDPPLNMPTWGHRLSGTDIDALIAYMLTLGPQPQAEPAS